MLSRGFSHFGTSYEKIRKNIFFFKKNSSFFVEISLLKRWCSRVDINFLKWHREPKFLRNTSRADAPLAREAFWASRELNLQVSSNSDNFLQLFEMSSNVWPKMCLQKAENDDFSRKSWSKKYFFFTKELCNHPESWATSYTLEYIISWEFEHHAIFCWGFFTLF